MLNNKISSSSQNIHSYYIQELLIDWQNFLNHLDWKSLICTTKPKDSGCGLIYELPNYLNRPNESFAIADMRNLPFSEPHYHADNETEIYFVLEGTARIIVSDKEQHVTQGNIIIIPSYHAHYVIPDKKFVIAVVNTPPFNPANYLVLNETNVNAGFDYKQFKRITTKKSYIKLFLYKKSMFYILSMLLISINQIETIQQKQTLPLASIWNNPRSHNPSTFSNDESKQSFLQDAVTFTSENNFIPENTINNLRIMTFNIRMWTRLNNESNFDAVAQLIKKIDPDIIIFQELLNWQTTYDYYKNLGYEHTIACITQNPSFGPAILAKKGTYLNSYSSIFEHQSKPERQLSFVRLDLIINGTPISIYGTHLEVDDYGTKISYELVRKNQLQEIIDNSNTLSHENIIIAGDFNTARKKDHGYILNNRTLWSLLQEKYTAHFNQPLVSEALDTLTNNNFRTSFELLKWKNPLSTCWAGMAIDFIFFGPQWNLPLNGSYSYYTDISDHFPIIVDIKL